MQNFKFVCSVAFVGIFTLNTLLLGRNWT